MSPPSSDGPPSSPSSWLCPLYDKHCSSCSLLWQHINSVHISRLVFPYVAFFESSSLVVCGLSSCWWASHSRFHNSGCRHLLSTGIRCGVLLVPVSEVTEIPRASYSVPNPVPSVSIPVTDSISSHDHLDIGLLSASSGSFQGPPAMECDVLIVLLDHIMVCPVSDTFHVVLVPT